MPIPNRDVRPSAQTTLPGWDALLLALLVFAVLMIIGLAEEGALPGSRVADQLRHPILGNLLPEAGEQAIGTPSPRPGDPLGLVLNALTLGGLIGYLLVDLLPSGRWRQRAKWLLLSAILLTALFLPAAKLILLRQGSGPASYTHDGGVIQTEATIQYFLAGKNPYREDYVETPMAEWGFSEYRTALYHYPYLPWTFIFSTPFYLLGQWAGFYDQRLVYLLLMAIALILAPQLVRGPRTQLALVTLLALNPIMALDLVFGQNDSFVLCWLLLSLVAWQRSQQVPSPSHAQRWRWGAALLLGVACASKPTAWFFAPFYGLLFLGEERLQVGWLALLRQIPQVIARVWPALLSFAVLVGPYIVWDPFAFYDDVWRWSSGQGETGYQIWGWGASNFVLALGLVADRFSQWPFWLLELVLAGPLLIWFLRRQQRTNTLANACWHYGLFLLLFFYSSRFLNENYLGYILAFLVLGILAQQPQPAEER